MICMKKTLNIEDKLLKEAKLASGAATDTEAVRLGLEALVRRSAYERLRTLRGSEPLAAGVPRRREKAVTKRRVASWSGLTPQFGFISLPIEPSTRPSCKDCWLWTKSPDMNWSMENFSPEIVGAV